MTVLFKRCQLFDETSAKHLTPGSVAFNRFQEFAKFKSQNPLAPFGKLDYPIKYGPLDGILHAAITHDLRIFYTVSGSEPKVFKLYAIMSHEETGIGMAGGGGAKKVKSLGKKFSNQQFPENKQ